VARIIEVALSDKAELDADVAANDAIIAADATRHDRAEITFWALRTSVSMLNHGVRASATSALGRCRRPFRVAAEKP
jgi:hypothetical protein